MSENGDRWYTVADVAQQFGVTRKTVYTWIDSGLLSANKIGWRTIRISQAQIDAFLERKRTTNQ
jgi:excisionase family DNA binding protein